MRKSVLIPALLWLAACSDGAPPQEPAPSFSPTADQREPVAQLPADAATQDTIPAAYLGVWDWTGGACDPVSDMRLEISAGKITFYESVGLVQAVRAEAGGIAIDLAMEGEGEQWVQTTRLRYNEEGPLLISELEDPQGNGRLRYKQCPAENAE